MTEMHSVLEKGGKNLIQPREPGRLSWCTGTTQRDGMGREEGSGWGTHVYLWQIHFDIWQNHYNIVKLNKIKFKKKEKKSQ